MCAVEAGNDKCVEKLIEAGADVDKQDKLGDTALIYSAGYNQGKCIDILLQKGADVNKQNHDGVTALMTAAKEGFFNCLEVLISAGADVNIQDKWFSTPLVHVAHTLPGQTRCALLLLKAGAFVNKITKYCHNALESHIVCCYRSEAEESRDLCMLLFFAGETVSDITIEAKSPYGFYFHIDVPDYLLHEDLKMNLKHLCRETVRKHLLNIERHENLFGRIPQIKLPSSLIDYLLYIMSQNYLDYQDVSNADGHYY